MPEPKRPKEEHISVRELAMDAQKTIRELEGRLSKLEAQFGALVLHTPKVERPMNRSEVDRRISDDRTAQFRVLAKYGHYDCRLEEGRIISIQQYPRLPEFVSAGLQVIAEEPRH